MLSYKFRIYPSKTLQQILNKQLELCKYNRLLFELNRAMKEGRKLKPKDTQALIVKLKPDLKEKKIL